MLHSAVLIFISGTQTHDVYECYIIGVCVPAIYHRCLCPGMTVYGSCQQNLSVDSGNFATWHGKIEIIMMVQLKIRRLPMYLLCGTKKKTEFTIMVHLKIRRLLMCSLGGTKILTFAQI
jgi:hypothetical protein